MKKQIFKGEVLTRTKVKNNIVRVWNEATETQKNAWYEEANLQARQLSFRYLGILNAETTRKACGIIAALSPMVNWPRNLELAEMLISGTDAMSMPCLKANAKKARAILDSDGSDDTILSILRGDKVSAFYLNIAYPEQAISLTIDRHALSIAVGKWLTDETVRTMTAGQYKFFVECYRWTAASLGINPLLLQSATWNVWREGLKKEYI